MQATNQEQVIEKDTTSEQATKMLKTLTTSESNDNTQGAFEKWLEDCQYNPTWASFS